MNSGVSGVFARVTPIRHADASARFTCRARPAPRTTLRGLLRNAYDRVLRLCMALKRRWFARRLEKLDIPSIVCSALAHHAHRDSSKLPASDTLYGDLGLTSLGLVLVALDVEDILGIQLDSHDLGSMQTVGDLLSATESEISSRRSLILLPDGEACSAPAPGSRAEVS